MLCLHKQWLPWLQVVSDLRVLMDEVTTLNKQRDTLMTSLKEQSSDDIGNYVLPWLS